MCVIVKWSKTIQCREKTLVMKIPHQKDHSLRAFTAVNAMFSLRGNSDPKSQAFPMKGALFNRQLKLLTSDSTRTSTSHSLRRGGATWALMSRVPEGLVKLMGDWAS